MNRLIDFSSRFSILKGWRVALVVSILLGSVTLSVAAPSGGTVTSGTAYIIQSGTVTNVNQSTQNATINWQNFSIANGETVNFNQPNASSITLNRIIGNEKSIIDGALNANGQVWLLNSNGILFGKNARVNTAGLLATTAELSDNDFNAGNYKFKNTIPASIINEGTIEIANSGSVILASNEVRNSGTIKAISGTVHLLGADSYSLNLNGNSLIELTVDKGLLDALVENSGTIIADGGEIYLTTNAVNELLDGIVNNTGIIEANSLDDITGEIILFAHGGKANVDGILSAKGGFIETSGKILSIKDTIDIKAKDWLLDPTNITIASSGAETLAGDPATTATVGDVTISAATIEAALATTNVTLEATNDINVNEALTNDTVGNKVLTLTADSDNDTTGSINVNAVVTIGDGDGININYGSSGYLTMKRDDTTNSFTGKINLDSTSVVNINSNPYTVLNTRADIEGISVPTITGNYVIGDDIEMTTADWIALKTDDFNGKLEGFGHTINDLTKNGLFDQTGNGVMISNLGLVDVNIDNTTDWTGALVGQIGGASSIYNVFATGSVDSLAALPQGTGGLIGYASAVDGDIIIKDSYFKGTIDTVGASRLTGGLIGRLTSNSARTITIFNSYVEATIDNVIWNAGGLVGSYSGNNNTTEKLIIENSYANVTIDAAEDAGGIIGDISDSSKFELLKSYTKGSISGSHSAGGLLGSIGNTGGAIITVSNTYSTADIASSAGRAGGLIGKGVIGAGSITIDDSYYASSSLTGSTAENGIIGAFFSGTPTINNSYFDNTMLTGMGDDVTYGKSTTNMKNIATFSGAGWNIATDYNSIWHIEDTVSYPCLSGVGTTCSAPVVVPPVVVAPVVTATKTTTTVVKTPVVQISTPPNFSNKVVLVSTTVEKTPIVSQPIVGEKTKKVTQTEVQTMQNSETTLVPVGKGALLQLVNSGVTLPEGVEQEFYVVEDNRR